MLAVVLCRCLFSVDVEDVSCLISGWGLSGKLCRPRMVLLLRWLLLLFYGIRSLFKFCSVEALGMGSKKAAMRFSKRGFAILEAFFGS